jgi:hypothetical protein
MSDPEYRHTRVPRIDPEKWDEQPVFREAFMWYVSDPKNDAAFRVFSQSLYSMALESCRSWDGTFAEAEAERLRAVVADLRYLQGFLTTSFEAEMETEEEEEEGHMTPRKARLWRFSGTLVRKIAALADEVEKEIQESLQEDDDDTELRRRLSKRW